MLPNVGVIPHVGCVTDTFITATAVGAFKVIEGTLTVQASVVEVIAIVCDPGSNEDNVCVLVPAGRFPLLVPPIVILLVPPVVINVAVTEIIPVLGVLTQLGLLYETELTKIVGLLPIKV